jgi:hypothetical protein
LSHYRPAGSDILDEHTIPLGVPVAAQDGIVKNQPFYVVKMEQTLAVMDKCMWQSAGASKPIPFDNLKLGPILGKGSFGRVYRGIYNGGPVAVKVPTSVKNEGWRQFVVLRLRRTSALGRRTR